MGSERQIGKTGKSLSALVFPVNRHLGHRPQVFPFRQGFHLFSGPTEPERQFLCRRLIGIGQGLFLLAIFCYRIGTPLHWHQKQVTFPKGPDW
jgi:hypothetical protein